ncbi:MAG: hypothetical protein IJA47_06965 [Oscillospiraceae bacterium]|nr:hypothetical protein [Oscillospiraceae bacterium]
MPTENREFRRLLGFTNQEQVRKFFKATDFVIVNLARVERCNERLKEIFRAIHQAVHTEIRVDNIDQFCSKVDVTYQILNDNNILPRMNNYGRAPDDVYYSWMRGYLVCEYFSKALAQIFGVEKEAIALVGDDQLTNIETFSQSPTADLEITLPDRSIRIEVQSGFTGTNDIKKHKVVEAKRLLSETGTLSYVVHFDLFNGKAALIDISSISDTGVHWENRAQMEDQQVFSIPQNAFLWDLTDAPQTYTAILYQE